MIDTKELALPPPPEADRPGSLDVALAPAKAMPDPANLTLLVAAIAQVSEAVLITDTTGIIQYVNPAFTQMTGYSAEEAHGQNTRLLKSDRQDPVYYRKLWQTILAGKAWRGELLNRRKDGTVYAEEMSITPVRDGKGAVTHFIAIKQDLSEYRATREALRNSERRLEEIQRITPLGSWELNLEEREVRGSRGFLAIFGCPPDAGVVRLDSLLERLPEADRERVIKVLELTVKTREPFDLEHRVVLGDGSVRVVRSRGQVVEHEGPKRLCGTTLDITEGKLSHERLRLSEEKFRSLVANIPDVTWTVAAHGRACYVSPNVEQLLGFTAAELCERPAFWMGQLDPGHSQRILKAFHNLFSGGQPYDLEYRLQRKDGQWIWVHDRAYRTYEKDGVRYADGVFADVTERKRGEQRLLDSKQFLQATLNAISSHVAILDENGAVVAVNAAWRRFMAANGGEGNRCGVGSNYLEVCDRAGLAAPEASAAAQGIRQTIAGTLDEFSFEYPCHSPEQERWFVMKVTPFADEGRRSCVVIAHQDITTRKLAEQTLQKSEEKFRQLAENIREVFWMMSPAGDEILYVSPAYEQVWGRPCANLYRNPMAWAEAIHPDDLEHAHSAFARQMQGESIVSEYRIRTPDGLEKWISDRAFPVRDQDGRIIRVVGIAEEITERKRADAALRASEKRYRLLFERNLAGVFLTTAAGRILDCNEAAAQMFGYHSPEEIRDLSITAVYHNPSDRDAVLTRLRSEKKLTNHEIKFHRKDGSAAWALVNFTLVDTDSGETIEGTFVDITERKRVEKELRMAQFSVEHASDAVRWVDSKGRIFYANEAACRALGRSREELLSLSVLDVDKFFFLKETWEAYWEELKARGTMTFESQNIAKQGRVFPVEITANYLEFDGKEYSFAFVRDITERRRAEEVRERLAAVIESSDDAIIGKTLDGIITAWNSGAEKLFGYSSSEAVGQSIQMLLPPERAHEESEILGRIRRGESVDHFETVRVRKDGRHIDMSATISPIKDSSGAIVGASKIARDITERKRAEEEARESSELVRLLLDSIPEAVYGIDMHGNCTFFNPCCLRLLGYREDVDLHGKDMHALMHHTREDGTPYPVEECHIYEAFRRGQGTHIDDEILWRRDGTSFSAEYWSHPLYRRGKVIGTVVTFVDITERKRVEQVLRQAKEAAEAANLAKSQFLANMSHEIRTPMNGVIGVAGLLLDTPLTPEQRQYAQMVRDSGESLLRVINDILDFSKIEARKLTLEVAAFDLRVALQSAVDLLAIRASEKGLELTGELAPGTPVLLEGDPHRLRQILINLVGNAVKFTQHGKVAIWAGLEIGGDQEDAATLRFLVTDTGIGFPQNLASNLFEPFVQADGSSTRRYGGTGLGLTISRQLVEMMGGQIGVESEVGKGSTFWFTAAFKKQRPKQTSELLSNQDASKAAAALIASPVTATVSRGGAPSPGVTRSMVPARILVAEDNPVNQTVAVAMLTKLGYRADLVSNGAEALRLLSQNDYDLVLMDCGMPKMDGYEATRRIRDRRAPTRNPLLPIIAFTADAMSGDREKCLAVGMSDYLPKPIELHQLDAILRKWLDPTGDGKPKCCPAVAPASVEIESAFNPKALLSRLMNDNLLARQVVAAFLDDAPRQLLSLQQFVQAGDAEGARRQAHTLKGAAANLSADSLCALCLEAQQAAEAGELRQVASLLPPLQQQFEFLKAALHHAGWV